MENEYNAEEKNYPKEFYLCRSFFLWLFIFTVPVLLIPLMILSIFAGSAPPPGWEGDAGASLSPITIFILSRKNITNGKILNNFKSVIF